MHSFLTIAGWAMLLIFVYLLFSHGQIPVNLTNALSSASVAQIKALQGR